MEILYGTSCMTGTASWRWSEMHEHARSRLAFSGRPGTELSNVTRLPGSLHQRVGRPKPLKQGHGIECSPDTAATTVPYSNSSSVQSCHGSSLRAWRTVKGLFWGLDKVSSNAPSGGGSGRRVRPLAFGLGRHTTPGCRDRFASARLIGRWG